VPLRTPSIRHSGHAILVPKGGAGLATVFTRIIEGEVPAGFLWRDPSCVAFLNVTPLTPGHTLIVP
jgi:HIT domain